MATATAVPTGISERIRGIDTARGLALLGILLVNARMFFLPIGCALDPAATAPGLEATIADKVAWSLVEILCTYKCISLFSLLFGFGLARQVARAAARTGGHGAGAWGVGARRLLVLLVVGLLHGTLVWYGDILAMYAVLGFGVLLFASIDLKWTRRAFVAIVTLIAVLSVAAAVVRVVVASNPAWAAEFSPPAATDTTLRGWTAMTTAGFDLGSPTWLAAETAAYATGPFADALLFRVVSYGFALLAAAFGYGWHAFAMMLVGVWACRTDLFAQDDADASRRRRRLARTTLPLGLALSVGSVLPFWALGLDSPLAAGIHTVGLEFAGLVLPVAYAVLLVEFAPRWPAAIATPLERAGRMSLSVYLAESLVATALASWWGLAWFGTMLDARFSLVAIAVWAALVLAASVWTAWFGAGPMERLWRLAAYGRIGRGPAAAPRQAGAPL